MLHWTLVYIYVCLLPSILCFDGLLLLPSKQITFAGNYTLQSTAVLLVSVKHQSCAVFSKSPVRSALELWIQRCIWEFLFQVESLTAARKSCLNGNEPSDAIRVVNAVLTQIDQLKK